MTFLHVNESSDHSLEYPSKEKKTEKEKIFSIQYKFPIDFKTRDQIRYEIR